MGTPLAVPPSLWDLSCHSLSLLLAGPGQGLQGSWKRPQLLWVHRGLALDWHLLTW